MKPRKSVQKSSGGASAVLPLDRGESQSSVKPDAAGGQTWGGYETEILYFAPQIPKGISLDSVKDVPPKRCHEITVRAFGSKFRLYNNGTFAGPRHVKKDDDDLRFPFQWDDWWILNTFDEAKEAADALQSYLDTYENPKLPAALKRWKQQQDDDFIPL